MVGGATGTPTTPGTVVVTTDATGSVDVVTVGTKVVIVPVEAFGSFPDTNSAMQSTPGKYSRNGFRVGAGGASQFITGKSVCAASIYAFQIFTGYALPVTRATPSALNSGMLTIGVYPFGSPTHTAVVSCLVKPTNHALVFSSCVPVLPPAGRLPSSGSRRAVPLISVCFKISTSASAISFVITCDGAIVCWYSNPLGPSIFSMK